MSKVEGGGGGRTDPLPPHSSLRVTNFSSRLPGLKFNLRILSPKRMRGYKINRMGKVYLFRQCSYSRFEKYRRATSFNVA